jgi:transcriptional regulator with XRE-family HTH domain
LQTDFFGRGHRTSLNDYLEGKRTPSLEVFMDLAELLYVDPGEVSNNFFDRRTKK